VKPLIAYVIEHSVQSPGKVAVVQDHKRVTYGELIKKIKSAAFHLERLGVAKGDRVILSASNTPSFLYGYFAAHLLGAIAVPLPPQTPDSRLSYIIDKISPRSIFINREFEYKSHQAKLTSTFDHLDEADKDYPLPTPGMTADILFTTGTTGESKGVVLTHKNIYSQAANINTFIGNTAEDIEVLPLPLSHSFGLGRLRCNVVTGGTIILVDGFLVVGKIFQAFEEWKATGFCFVPAGLGVLFKLSADKIGQYADQLKYIEIGSAPMPMENKLRLMRLLPHTRICMHYGLTEASRATFIEFHESRHKLDSIGQPSPNVEVKIIDKKGGEAPVNEIGEILVRGNMVMQEYWNDPHETAGKLANGWIRTSDVGCKDEDGFFYLRGREKELINIAGRKAAPEEIEFILNKHPQVEDCACIGIPDPDQIKGETVKAFVVLKKGLDTRPSKTDFYEFLRGQIEEYKIPTVYQWMDRIPKTDSGKLQRALLQGK
jgi:long-chain acyl-CoA synthetase